MTTFADASTKILEEVARRARDAAVFGPITLNNALICNAKHSAEDAWYILSLTPEPSIALKTPARYLSQSIEQDLVHTGDKLEDLLAEELEDLRYQGPRLTFQHFRDPDKLYTFLSPIPVGIPAVLDPNQLAIILLAYEACFRRLGDMEASDE